MNSNTSATADQLHDLRRANSARCAEEIRTGAAATITDIAIRTGLSRPTVTARLQDLLDDGLVEDVGAGVAQGAGRPANRFRFRPEAALVAGVELTKTTERVLFVDLMGRTIARDERPAARASASDRLASAAAWVMDGAARHEATNGRLERVCVTFPGAMDATGTFVEAAAFEEWKGEPIPPIVQAAFPLPVDVIHDLAAAMIAERRMGAAADVDTFVVPVLWHRVSAGIVVNGEVYDGPHGAAGRPHVLKRFEASPTEDQEWADEDAVAELVSAADAGDPRAVDSVMRFAAKAAEQIAILQLVIDPQLVVLYGPCSVHDGLVERVRQSLRGHVDIDIPVVVSEFGLYGTVLGSALIALDNASEALIGPGLTPLELDRSSLTWAIDGQRAQARAR